MAELWLQLWQQLHQGQWLSSDCSYGSSCIREMSTASDKCHQAHRPPHLLRGAEVLDDADAPAIRQSVFTSMMTGVWTFATTVSRNFEHTDCSPP